MWVAETDPRSQSGCWQCFRESQRKQGVRQEAREREGDREREREREKEVENEGNKMRHNERKRVKDAQDCCEQDSLH